MSKNFIDDAARARLTEAIVAIETASSVEVVVKVRHHSGSYLHADVLGGVIGGVAALAFMLLSPRFHFSSLALLIDPLVIGVLFGLFTTQLPMVRRWLTPPRRRRAQVREAAEAAFVQRGVSHTSGRTGLLVYASLLERAVELVCDRGVCEALSDAEIEAERLRIENALRAHFDGEHLARAIRELAPVCGGPLPRQDDDVNELPDQVYFHP